MTVFFPEKKCEAFAGFTFWNIGLHHLWGPYKNKETLSEHLGNFVERFSNFFDTVVTKKMDQTRREQPADW